MENINKKEILIISIMIIRNSINKECKERIFEEGRRRKEENKKEGR